MIISQVLTKSSQHTTDKTVLPSQTPSTVTSLVIQTPKLTPNSSSVPTHLFLLNLHLSQLHQYRQLIPRLSTIISGFPKDL
ncbi:MAG: hypothetical protein V7L25_05760 [Nostoc sp.]